MAHRGAVLAAALAAALLTAGCGGVSTGVTRSQPAAVAPPQIDRDVRCWGGQGLSSNVQSLSDILPNTLFSYAGTDDKPRPLTPLVIVGRVVDVDAGTAWRAMGDGTRLRFDDPRALWKSVHAVVAVDEVLGAVGDASPDQVLIGFPLDGDESLEAARGQLVSDQQLMLPLHQWAGTDYNAELWAVGPGNEQLLAEVGGDGALTLPCVSSRTADRLLRDVPTLDSLRDAAARPTQTRRVVALWSA